MFAIEKRMNRKPKYYFFHYNKLLMIRLTIFALLDLLELRPVHVEQLWDSRRFLS